MTPEFLQQLRENTCFFASFDNSLDADFSLGDKEAESNGDVVRHVTDGGRFGGAVGFHARDHGWAEDELRYRAKANFPYQPESFDGSISMWLCGDPDADLSPDYPVDPFHISRHAADASFYLDLTRPNDWRYGSPRKLRFGFYNDNPQQDMYVGGQLIVASELGFKDGKWHHIVATWQNANSGEANGSACLYIDGRLRGTMQGYEHQLTWELDDLMMGLGQRYVGKMEEFLVCRVALTANDVAMLYRAEMPLSHIF